MQNKRTFLKRTGSLKRGKPLARVSKRHRVALYEYFIKRKRFLDEHPECQCCHRQASRDVHHTCGRSGSNLLDEATWMAVCRACHTDIHQHPSKARALGWLK